VADSTVKSFAQQRVSYGVYCATGGGVPGDDGGAFGGGGAGADGCEQSGVSIHAPPARVQPQATGTTTGGSAVAIRAAIIPATIVGRIRPERNFNATPPRSSADVMGCLAIGPAILCFRFPKLLTLHDGWRSGRQQQVTVPDLAGTVQWVITAHLHRGTRRAR
jgi:hypothetical protein